MRCGFKFPGFWLMMVAGLLFGNAEVMAQQGGYPQPKDNYVNDYAGVLTAADAQTIRAMFAKLENEAGIEATVVTVYSVYNYDTGDITVESFATNLFNTWGIGDRIKNNGVLILVAIHDRKVRIELGEGYGREFNPAMQRVIDNYILPEFRQGNYSRGLLQGSRATIGELTGTWPEVSISERIADMTAVFTAHPWISSIAGVVALVFGGFRVRRYLRYRKRRCPNCHTAMVRLDEVSDDLHLDSGQKVEELLKSVDYDVWKCPDCNMHELHRYGTFLSDYKSCPQCRYRTVKSSQKTIRAATYESSGSARITRTCRHCQHKSSEIITLPKLTRSSSSSGGSSSGSSSSRSSGGSSFGGGSSSGSGGASGSW